MLHVHSVVKARVADPDPVFELWSDPDPGFKIWSNFESGFQNSVESGMSIKVLKFNFSCGIY